MRTTCSPANKAMMRQKLIVAAMRSQSGIASAVAIRSSVSNAMTMTHTSVRRRV